MPNWGWKHIKASEAYGVSKGDGVVIGVIGTSGSIDHPDLITNALNQFAKNYTDDGPEDRNGHETHVMGIIAAENNDIGVVGIAPEAKLVPLKALNDLGRGNYVDVIKAGDDFADADLGSYDNYNRILNLSLGGPGEYPALEAAIKRWREKNVLVIVSAGNSGHSDPDRVTTGIPANYENCLSIGSLDATLKASSFSSRGRVSLVYPGSNVYSTGPGGGYVYLSGTSMAAPMASGVAALIWGANPSLSGAQVAQALFNGAKLSEGWEDASLYGKGICFPVDGIEEGKKLIDTPVDEEPPVDEVGGEISVESMCNVIYRDHRANANSIYYQIGGYTITANVTLALDDATSMHDNNVVNNHVDAFFASYRQTYIKVSSDTKGITHRRTRIINADGVSLNTLGKHLKTELQKYLVKVESTAKVVGMKLNDGFTQFG